MLAIAMFSQIDADELWLAFGSKLHFTNSWSCQGIGSSNVQKFASFLTHLLMWHKSLECLESGNYWSSSWRPHAHGSDLSLSLLGAICSAYMWSNQWYSNSQWYQEILSYTEVKKSGEHTANTSRTSNRMWVVEGYYRKHPLWTL